MKPPVPSHKVRPGRATLMALIGCVALAGGVIPSTASATTIGFEGVASSNSATIERNRTRLLNGFNVFSSHGHYLDSGWLTSAPQRPSNGTDNFLADNDSGITLTEQTDQPFSLSSFDATEELASARGASSIRVLGTYSGGGSILADFTTAPRASGVTPVFQTFALGAGWTHLASVQILPLNSGMWHALDNVVVNAVPEPSTGLLLGLGLLALAARGRPRSH